MLLVCLLGSNALAQTRTTYTTLTEVKEIIDFTGLPMPDDPDNDRPNAEIDWEGTTIKGISGINGVEFSRLFTTNYPISVGTSGNWHVWRGSHGQTYLQKNTNNDSFSISNLKTGDEVTIWGDNGDQNGGFRVTSTNTSWDGNDITFNNNSHQANQTLKMSSNGTLELYFYNRYSGVLKIEIKREIDQATTFDYDPGYEQYDLYDEFSWGKNENPATTYNFNNGSAGFQLNGSDAKYITLSGSKITTNNRIALTGAANEWTFDFGLVPPGTNGDYSYFSICNLREGDRVVISYINESENPLIFASGENNGEYYYNGCAAFKDDNRNGVLNEGEEYISNGNPASIEWHRGEGNVGNSDRGWGSGYAPELYYINSYVIAQDGHLDLAFRRFVENDDASGDHQDPNKTISRIVKIKIYSDHQAMMVDKYENHAYTSYFNITGELQAKEHIMPGGLEIHVGNDDVSQHAIVVSSKEGPVSYVNAVDGYKIPGVEKSSDGSYYIPKFNLDSDLPTTGTFYRFIPEVTGDVTVKFETKSINYYRWDLTGNAVYYYNNWTALFDRPNEQTIDVSCPYYLVRIYKDNQGNEQKEFTLIGNYPNGGGFEKSISVTAGETYYIYGGWNCNDGFFNGSDHGAFNGTSNNIEFVPNPDLGNGQYNQQRACGVAELLWVKFERDKSIYPLAKWVPNGTTDVNDLSVNNFVPNPDTFAKEYELATVEGYDNTDLITVKKYFGNITGCEPYFKFDSSVQGGSGKLMIKNIQFGAGPNKGGTILLKIGDPTDRNAPLYALTVAYSASVDDSNNRGHLWDFYTKSLSGMEWENGTPNGAVVKPLGTYFQNYSYGDEIPSSSFETVLASAKNENSLLYKEISTHSDWMFNYNLKYDEKMYDPVFTNKYDMEGDNADMICETEGTVIRTSANQSCIFNEFNGDVQHTESNDPNRYVGILKGGEFRIPWLMPNDRVIIWMGTGKGRSADQAVFNIRGAYDAVHNLIGSEDEYIVGGSQWTVDEGSDYQGCYHFFAQGHDGGPADVVGDKEAGRRIIDDGDHDHSDGWQGRGARQADRLIRPGLSRDQKPRLQGIQSAPDAFHRGIIRFQVYTYVNVLAVPCIHP